MRFLNSPRNNEQLRCAASVECSKDSTLDSNISSRLAWQISSRLESRLASELTSRLSSSLESRVASGLTSRLTLRLASRELAVGELAVRELSSRVASELAFRLGFIFDLKFDCTSDFTVALKLASTLHLTLDSTLDSVINKMLDLPLDSAFYSVQTISTASMFDFILGMLESSLIHALGPILLWTSYHRPLDSSKPNPFLTLTLAQVTELDRLILRAKKNVMLRDVIPGIVEDLILPTLRAMNFGSGLNLEVIASGMDSLDAQIWRLQSLIAIFIDAVSASGLEFAYNALVSAVVLSVVYQYLIGYVDRGGTKTYNSGSLEFRATYVSLLLFQGAYVWIKFRDAPKRTVSRRSRTDNYGNLKFGKWLPVFKPPREKDVATGTSQEFQCLRLAGYDTKRDGEVVWQIAGFYYGVDAGLVKLKDGFRFDIPPMSEQEWGLSGMEKWNWVSDKAKEVFKQDFRKAHDQWRKSRRIMPEHVDLPTGQAVGNVNDLHGHTEPQPLLDAVSTAIEDTRIGSGGADYDIQLPENPPSPGIQNRQEVSNAQLGSTPDSVARGADGIVDNQQPLFDLPTTRSVRTYEIVSLGGTLEADLVSVFNDHGEGHGACQRSVVNGADHSTGRLTNLETFENIDFDTLAFDVTFPAASTAPAMSPSDTEDDYEVYLWQ